MFGIIHPNLNLVSETHKNAFNASYCNLCASLSGAGFGPLNRFFLINDIVTIDWLFSDPHPSHPFSCHNCLKGGVIGRKHRIDAHQKFLAALSSYIFGIKVMDDLFDDATISAKIKSFLYRPFIIKAKRILETTDVLDKIKNYVNLDKENNLSRVSSLQMACEPSEKSYELIALKIAEQYSYVPPDFVSLLGRYLGRYVYLFDAFKDRDKDSKNKQYNVLNEILPENSIYCNREAAKLCLSFLKPMRNEITTSLNTISKFKHINSLNEKMNSVFINIENKLVKLVNSLDDQYLVMEILAFTTRDDPMKFSIEGGDDGCPLKETCKSSPIKPPPPCGFVPTSF